MVEKETARSRRTAIAPAQLAATLAPEIAEKPDPTRRAARAAPAIETEASQHNGFSMLDALPHEALLPVSWVRQALVEHERLRAVRAVLPTVLTPAEFAMHYRPSRTEEWVRDMCLQRRLPGATKRGRAWLIPSALLESGPIAERGHPGFSDSSSASATQAVATRLSSRRARPTNDPRY